MPVTFKIFVIWKKSVSREVTHLMMTLKLFRVKLIKANYEEFQMGL